MRKHEIVDRAIKDPQWGAELAQKAARAARTEVNSETLRGPEWTALLSEFAETPDDLARMVSFLEEDLFPTAPPTTTTTTTTITGTSLTTLATGPPCIEALVTLTTIVSLEDAPAR